MAMTIQWRNAMSNKVMSLSVAAALMGASGIAFAVTAASSPIPVSATVSQACSISTTSALAFGAYDPVGVNASAALNATGQISVTCSRGASGLTVGMGLGSQPVGTQRQMKGGLGGLLNYNIFQPASNVAGTACTFPGTVPWTETGAGLLTLVAAPSKVARLYNVCGTIPGNQDVAVDGYLDVVSATLNF
jgi:spore coat protein U-like protein